MPKEDIQKFIKQAEDYADTYDDRHTPIWFQMFTNEFSRLLLQESQKLGGTL